MFSTSTILAILYFELPPFWLAFPFSSGESHCLLGLFQGSEKANSITKVIFSLTFPSTFWVSLNWTVNIIISLWIEIQDYHNIFKRYFPDYYLWKPFLGNFPRWTWRGTCGTALSQAPLVPSPENVVCNFHEVGSLASSTNFLFFF